MSVTPEELNERLEDIASMGTTRMKAHIKALMPKRVPLESEEARTFVAWLRIKGLKFTHIGNETGHDPYSRRRAIRLKQQGTSKGFPDYLVITNTGLIAIELKRQKGSTTSPEQRQWIEALTAAEVPAYIAKGAQEAIELVERHQWPNGAAA